MTLLKSTWASHSLCESAPGIQPWHEDFLYLQKIHYYLFCNIGATDDYVNWIRSSFLPDNMKQTKTLLSAGTEKNVYTYSTLIQACKEDKK